MLATGQLPPRELPVRYWLTSAAGQTGAGTEPGGTGARQGATQPQHGTDRLSRPPVDYDEITHATPTSRGVLGIFRFRSTDFLWAAAAAAPSLSVSVSWGLLQVWVANQHAPVAPSGPCGPPAPPGPVLSPSQGLSDPPFFPRLQRVSYP